MSFRHHHHYQQPAEYVEEYAREEDRIYGGPPRVNAYSYDQNTNFQRNERLGELGAVAAGAFAVYEGHEAKVDPQNARMHKYEEEAAAVGGVASAGYAYHEHREKKKYENDRW